MKLYIGKKHEAEGYFKTAQKDGKDGSQQTYRGIFAVYDRKTGNWTTKTHGGFTIKGDAKKWADERYKEFVKNGKAATLAKMQGKTNFAGFVERHYIDYLKDELQLKGIKQELQKVDVLVEFFGSDKIDDIDLLRVKEFKKWLLKRPYTRVEGGQEFTVSKTTTHRYLARLKHLLRYASDTLETRVPPFRDLIKKSDEKPKQEKFTFEELQRMIAACDELFPRKPENRNGWKLVLIAAYTLGCRVNELFDIKGKHIKSIDEANRVGVIELDMPDSDNKIHAKRISITTWLYNEMEAAGLFDKGDDERLFMWTRYYRRPFDQIRDKAKANPNGTFHTLRATSITDKVASGQDIEDVQQEAGHKKGSNVTARHYIRPEDRQIIEAASRFNQKLEQMRIETVIQTEAVN